MMAQLRIDFQGRGKVETLPRARVEAMRDGVQFTLRVPRQVRALRQVLAQQPVGVLVRAALPRTIRISKEDLDGKPVGELRVLGPLFPTIIGQGFAQQGGHMPEFLGEAFAGTRRIRPLHPGQDDQTCGPIHQGANSRPVAGALDEVAFPVAGCGSAHRRAPLALTHSHPISAPKRLHSHVALTPSGPIPSHRLVHLYSAPLVHFQSAGQAGRLLR